jgi:excisionase family DNA binding protein
MMKSDTQCEPFPAERECPPLVNVREVARLLNCSTRHVFRLTDAGHLPSPVRLGALVRWRKTDVDQWIAGGCQSPTMANGGQS